MDMFKVLLQKWMLVAKTASAVNTAVILALFYLVVMTPIGLMMRLFGKSAISAGGTGSMWVERGKESSFERQF